jgi:protein SCO1/2
MFNSLRILILSSLLLLSACTLAGKQQSTSPNKANSVHPFTLTDQNGQPFTSANLNGKWSFIFLGYTSCPDVCPTTLMELNFAFAQLQELTRNQAQVILVTADPQRDSQQRLKDYIRYFNKSFIALRAEYQQLNKFTQNLGLVYNIPATDKSNAFYTVDHSAEVVLINPNGEIQTHFKPVENEAGILTIDVEQLIANVEIITSFFN